MPLSLFVLLHIDVDTSAVNREDIGEMSGVKHMLAQRSKIWLLADDLVTEST